MFKETKLHCVDLGARAGAPDNWKPFAANMTIDAFEPDLAADDKGYKEKDGVSWFPFGLAAQSTTLPFHVTGVASGSSLYPPNEAVMPDYSKERYWRVSEIRQLPFLTFSDFLAKYSRPKPELMKLDTQGSELDILKSLADDGWSDVLAVETEVEFIELYKGQPVFRDVDAFMDAKGFELMDLRTHRAYVHRGDRSHFFIRNDLNFAYPRHDFSARLLAGDALYVRRFKGGVPPDEATVRKLALIYCIYRFFDQALALCANAVSSAVLTQEAGKSLRDDILGVSPRPRAHESTTGIPRKILTVLNHVYTKAARALGYRPARRGVYQAGWSIRAWPDQ
jgi:FkbM family methyltransferase